MGSGYSYLQALAGAAVTIYIITAKVLVQK